MKRRLMITTAVLACSLALPAFGQDDIANSVVINGQLNLGDVWSSLNVTARNVDGDVDATSAAIGNSFSANLGDHSEVDNFQRVWGVIGSEVNVDLRNVGDVNVTSAAVGNTASIHSHGNVPCPNDPSDCPELRAELALNNRQAVEIDPFSLLNLTANGVGNVNGTSAAIGNSLSVDIGGPNNSITSWQGSAAETTSIVNATINGAGSVSLTSAAVANTVSIDQLGD